MIMQWTKQSSTLHTARWNRVSFRLEQDPKTYRWHCRADGRRMAVSGKVQTWPSAGIAMNHMDAVQTDALKKRRELFVRPSAVQLGVLVHKEAANFMERVAQAAEELKPKPMTVADYAGLAKRLAAHAPPYGVAGFVKEAVSA